MRAQDDRVFKTLPDKDLLVNRIGKEEQIAGKIFGGEHFAKTGITKLYFGDPAPNQVITLIIAEKDRMNFPQPPEVLYTNQDVKVKGVVALEDGKLVIVITRPEQISTVKRRTINYKE